MSIAEALVIYRADFPNLRIVLSTPSKDAISCPICGKYLSYSLICSKKDHYYNLSSGIMLLSILHKLASVLNIVVETRNLNGYKLLAVIGGTRYYFEFREHEGLHVLAVSKNITKVFPNIQKNLEIFEKTSDGLDRRILLVDI